jgi:hypothetical protein
MVFLSKRTTLPAGKAEHLERDSKMTKIELPHHGFELSKISGEAQAFNWIEVEEKETGVFEVVDNNMTVKDGDPLKKDTALGFSQWDEGVEDLDNGQSDERRWLGISSHLRWQDVNLTPDRYTAPNIERLKEALTHVVICAWCLGDI